jgi:hypothetical protein
MISVLNDQGNAVKLIKEGFFQPIPIQWIESCLIRLIGTWSFFKSWKTFHNDLKLANELVGLGLYIHCLSPSSNVNPQGKTYYLEK